MSEEGEGYTVIEAGLSPPHTSPRDKKRGIALRRREIVLLSDPSQEESQVTGVIGSFSFEY